MKAPGRLDWLYREQFKNAEVDRLMLQVFGGPEGMKAAAAYIRAMRAVRIAQGRATKIDRLAREWDRKAARRSLQQSSTGDER